MSEGVDQYGADEVGVDRFPFCNCDCDGQAIQTAVGVYGGAPRHAARR